MKTTMYALPTGYISEKNTYWILTNLTRWQIIFTRNWYLKGTFTFILFSGIDKLNYLNRMKLYNKTKNSKLCLDQKALVESSQAPVGYRNLNFCAHSVHSAFAEKTMFCFESALYWTESTKLSNVLPLHLVFSSSQNSNVDNICRILTRFQRTLFKCLGLHATFHNNLCQKLLFLHQLTNNMTTYYSLNSKFNTWKFQAQNWGEHVVYRIFFSH